MTHQRDRIHDQIRRRPGTHFNDLTRRLDLAPGQVQYHLRRLRGEDRVVEHQRYGRTHYYPPTFDAWERDALALFRRETARDIMVWLLEHERGTPATVAADLSVARSTLEWHLDHLVECDIVEKRRDANNHVTLVLARPEDTVALLADIEPSLPERLVDRFTRLFDGIFESGGD